jgi:hypothetical protein
VGELLF